MNTELTGQIVEHRIFGRGVIEDTRWGGSEALVRFGRVKLWVPMRLLRIIGKEVKTKPVSFIKGPKKPHFSSDVLKARRMIEAFRYGIVPHHDIEDFTFGREEEIKVFNKNLELLEKTGGRTLLIEGEYGSGKTHFLDYLYDIATKKDLVVAKAELDIFEVTPSRPLRLYQALTSTFTWKGGGFKEFLLEAANIELDEYHTFLTPLFDRIKRGNVNELLWQWISGERHPRIYLNQEGAYKLPVLLNHSCAGNLYTYILSAIGWLARKMGLRGFLILLDEVETTFRLWYNWYMGESFMKALVLVAKNEPEMTDLYTATEKYDLAASNVRKTPFLFKVPSGIFLVLASTPLSSTSYGEFKDLVDEVIYLTPLSRGHFSEMFRVLSGIYQVAYPQTDFSRLDLLFQLVERKGNYDVRTFIKASIEAFDLIRHYPKKNPLDLLKDG